MKALRTTGRKTTPDLLCMHGRGGFGRVGSWVLVFTAMLFHYLHSQPPSHFRNFTVRDGLTDNRVYCMVRDRQGLLWVGTANGLNRFDGYGFRNFLPAAQPDENTISGETINALQCDAQGRIWIGTGNGLSCWNPATEKFTHWNNTGRDNGSLPNPVVLALIFDQQQQLWLSCDNHGLVKYDAKANRFQVMPLREFALKIKPELPADFHLEVTGIFPKNKNELWLECNLGWISFHTQDETFQYFPVPEVLPLPAVEYKSCMHKNFLRSWENDVLCFDGCSEKWSKVPLPLGNEVTGGRRLVSSITHWKTGDIITAREGLFWMEGPMPQIQRIEAPPEGLQNIPTGALHCSYADETGALWIGGDNGLWLADPMSQHFIYQQLKQPESRDFYNTFGAFLEPEGDYFLAQDFYFHRLHIYQRGKQIKTLDLPPRANLLYQDQEKQIWTGGGNELFLLERPAFTLKKVKVELEGWENKTKGYFTMMLESEPGMYWFGHTEEGLIGYESNSGKWFQPGDAQSFPANHVSSLLWDQQENCLWIATPDYGLFRYRLAEKTFQLFQHDPSRPGNSIPAWMATDICRDDKGNLFISTDPGGVTRYEGGEPGKAKFTTWGTAAGLPSGRAISLLKDKEGRIWTGTLSGVACIDPGENKIRRFGAGDGLVQEFMDLPLWMNEKGEILNGTIYGVQKWNPDSLLRPVTPAKIYLSAFRIFDKDISDSLRTHNTGEIQLSWKENFFSFSLISSDITRAASRNFAWKLHGFEENWNEGRGSSNREGSYTNVPPGEYLLEIRSGTDGEWEAESLKIKIIITPPFWQTWWFRIGVVLLVGGLVYYLFRRRINQVKREEKLRSDFNQRIAQTEMAALRAQMNPHFVFNCLNSINRYIMVNEPEQASAYLSKFARLIRLILDNSRTDTVLLSRELEALQLYVEIERMRFDDKFEFRLEISPEVSPGSVEIPPLLIQPYVENAIWHGLMHKRGPGLLTVAVSLAGDKLKIEITDNGVGRKKAQEYKSKSASTQKSHGMQMTAERIGIINQLYGTQATVETTDLADEKGEAAGTKVTLIL